jgi:myo-inositol-1(or 4)-monophosphatase
MSYKDTVLPIIRATREITLPHWGTAEVIDKKTEAAGDVVTELDKKVEKFLREKLAEVHPDIKFVGEEEGGDRTAERFWLVDPIDGTGHYVRGLPFSTTMLALIEHGQVTFSVIYDFLNDDIYFAEKGKGAYKNDTPIRVSDRTLKDSYLCLEGKVAKEYNQKYFGKIIEKACYMSTVNCGWEFIMIASGKLDGRISFDPWGYDYDFAPGSLLVAEAGGVVTNIGSTEYDYTNIDFIAAGPKVYDEIVEIFKDYKRPL